MIQYDPNTRIFQLDTRTSSYIMQVIEGGLLAHVYYGAHVDGDVSYSVQFTPIAFAVMPAFGEIKNISYETVDMEYPTYGLGDFREPALVIEDAQGYRGADLRYCSHCILKTKPELAGLPSSYDDQNLCETLEVTMRDAQTGAEVVLQYTVFEECDAIAKSVSVKNTGALPLCIHRCLSSCLHLEDGDLSMLTLDGTYGNERHATCRKLNPGKQMVDSLRGVSSHAHNPFLALMQPHATEEFGWVYGSALVYSGNFIALAERDSRDKARAVLGIHPEGFSWLLEPGETFQSPEAIHVFSSQGLGGMSRSYHNFIRRHICRGEWRDQKRPLLVNNWEATYFNFSGEKLLEIADVAKDVGIEMLVLDDGWFGQRNDDHCSLGDWVPNEQKLGMTLGELAQELKTRGMQFGLWVEPEMISENSDLYRSHPDWCMHIPGRDRSVARSQLVLNFALPEVVEYIYQCLSKLFRCAEISYVKWDMNRNLSEVANPTFDASRQGETSHRYVLGLYHLLHQLTKAFPHILFESCSGGGGRFDLGMLCYMPQTWTSDNTDAIERLKIQLGTSVVYPVHTIGSHVSACPNHGTGRSCSMKTRGDVALCGTGGYELDLTQLTEEEKEDVRCQIARYHMYYDTIHFGDFYRLIHAPDSPVYAWMFVSKDKDEALVFWVNRLKAYNSCYKPLKLQGLAPNDQYKDTESGRIYSGSALMHMGLTIPTTWGDFQSHSWHLKKC